VTEVATYELDGAVLRLRYALGRNLAPPSRHASEFLLACVLQKARGATGVAVRPDAVCFRHAAGPELGEHRRFFAAPLRFGCDLDEIHLAPAALALPLVRADQGLRAVLDRHATDLLEKLPREELWSARLVAWLSAHLQGGEATLTTAARHFNLQARALQRQLQNEGETFESLIDQVRRTEALRLLQTSRLPIAEISFLLGFSEPSAFHRAFKRWTGGTAAAYRAAGPLGKR
jgi:AraC-like DNA-binding protein